MLIKSDCWVDHNEQRVWNFRIYTHILYQIKLANMIGELDTTWIMSFPVWLYFVAATKFTVILLWLVLISSLQCTVFILIYSKMLPHLPLFLHDRYHFYTLIIFFNWKYCWCCCIIAICLSYSIIIYFLAMVGCPNNRAWLFQKVSCNSWNLIIIQIMWYHIFCVCYNKHKKWWS